MDINGINSKDSKDALEALKLFGEGVNTSSKTKEPEQLNELVALDQADTDAFTALKTSVKEATDSSRVAMVAELREKFLAGELNDQYSGTAVADALLADGYGEFLIS